MAVKGGTQKTQEAVGRGAAALRPYETLAFLGQGRETTKGTKAPQKTQKVAG